ncbi:hypothetical protein ZIOFF_022062 [Zingiber officinale]|uniref:Uncharacterized protein n=1 Tax=Zingiber officinale TaxID=94328 RepID=A0A8J5LGY7_ZINOF|nr:hypothetical protein ZIOFF_022062 [Zingiber officinale]
MAMEVSRLLRLAGRHVNFIAQLLSCPAVEASWPLSWLTAEVFYFSNDVLFHKCVLHVIHDLSFRLNCHLYYIRFRYIIFVPHISYDNSVGVSIGHAMSRQGLAGSMLSFDATHNIVLAPPWTQDVCLSTNKVEELASGNTSLPCDALFDKEITDFIAQFFDNDSQSSAQAGVGSDDEPYSTLEVELSFLEFLIIPPPLFLRNSSRRSKRKSCGEAAELGVQGFLLWISSGGMVWSSDSGKRRANSTPHSTPPPPTVKLEVEEPLDEKRVRLHKRARDMSTSCEQVDPSLSLLIMFVSLSPRKSPSLADMIQMMLSQAKAVEELASGNTSLPCDALFDKEITDFIEQFFDNDSQSSAQAGVGSDDEPYSTLEVELSFLEFLIVPCCDKS